MFGGAAETEFDLRFPCFGVPVRVHPVFWLSSVFICWNAAVDAGGAMRPDWLVLCVFVVFVSVLVHELGHALVLRFFGFPSQIVLYFFGGYATATRKSTWKDIASLIAGPAAGFVLFGLTVLFQVYVIDAGRINNWDPVWQDRVGRMVSFSLFANLAWNVLNLIPVIPLDGGQICRELCLWFSPRKGMKWAVMIGLVVSGLIVLYGLACIQRGTGMFGMVEPRLPSFFFGYMAFQNFQAYKHLQSGSRSNWK